MSPTPTDRIDTDDLRRIAEAARGGPWRIERRGDVTVIIGIGDAIVCTIDDEDGPFLATVKLLALAPSLAAKVLASRTREAEMQADIDRLRNNCDMWRGQSERQAASLTEIRALLREGETGWQPIETAPKDGTPVIVTDQTFDPGMHFAFWNAEAGRIQCYDPLIDECWRIQGLLRDAVWHAALSQPDSGEGA